MPLRQYYDVVQFEAEVKNVDCYFLDERRTFLAIVNPPNVKEGDRLIVLVAKKKEDG